MLGQQNYDIIIKLLISVVLGTIIGIEREARGKSAGITTHSFVISGAMLFTVLSIFLEPTQPGRIASGIVTGIGFLCAGMILREHGERVANLTTAANVWFSAALGMAIGMGLYAVAVFGALFAVLLPQIHRIIHIDHNQN